MIELGNQANGLVLFAPSSNLALCGLVLVRNRKGLKGFSNMDQLAINALRMLAADAIQQAKSGHPGTPMDPAPTAYVLSQHFLRYDPSDPGRLNRDRFVLSCGHASMSLDGLIHLIGVKAANAAKQALGRGR